MVQIVYIDSLLRQLFLVAILVCGFYPVVSRRDAQLGVSVMQLGHLCHAIGVSLPTQHPIKYLRIFVTTDLNERITDANEPCLGDIFAVFLLVVPVKMPNSVVSIMQNVASLPHATYHHLHP